MSLQQSLPQSFIRAIELEQKCDLLLTSDYLSSFTPRKLASFGLAIINLSADNIRTAFAGRTTFELSLDRAYSGPEDQIQTGSIRVGDIVKLSRMTSFGETNDSSLEGVITRINEKAVHISITDDDADEAILSLYNNTSNENNRMWVAKLTNSITYKRMLQAMNKVQAMNESEKSEIIQILLGERQLVPREQNGSRIKFRNDALNQSQKDAVEFSIEHSPITIIHGPPGTGKTQTLIELIQQLQFNHKERILVCGASNTSVDNIVERLSPLLSSASNSSSQRKPKKRSHPRERVSADKLIRIGHPARLLPSNLKHSLDVLSRSNSDGEGGDYQLVLNDINNDIRDTLSAIRKCKRYSERKILWSEFKRLKKELKDKEMTITHELIMRAEVVVSTLHGAGSNELRGIYKNSEFSVDNPLFDTIIIDEVSQSSEPQCWIPLVNHLGCRRLVIAGDNLQLPPTIKSSKGASIMRRGDPSVANLEVTLFDRLVKGHGGDKFKKLLDVQYRMNDKIMRFSSQTLYQNRLTAAENVKSILLSDLIGVAKTDETEVPCIWYDTQGGDFPEQTEDETSNIMKLDLIGSKFNRMEAAVTIEHVKKLTFAGVSATDIGIISPYSAQVSIIKKLLYEENLSSVEVSTIDGFQGRENEAIILSLVRSNDLKEVGFLNDSRRLNVAMTRSKRHLCVIGDMELLEQSGVSFLREWAKHADETFEVRYPNTAEY